MHSKQYLGNDQLIPPFVANLNGRWLSKQLIVYLSVLSTYNNTIGIGVIQKNPLEIYYSTLN